MDDVRRMYFVGYYCTVGISPIQPFYVRPRGSSLGGNQPTEVD